MQPTLLVNVQRTSGGKLKWKSKVCGSQNPGSCLKAKQHSRQKPFKHLGCLYLPETLTFLPEIKVMLPYLTSPAFISHKILQVNCVLPLQVSYLMYGQSSRQTWELLICPILTQSHEPATSSKLFRIKIDCCGFLTAKSINGLLGSEIMS